MDFRTEDGLLIRFVCGRCDNDCETRKDRTGAWGRAFCNQCGATYALYIRPTNPFGVKTLKFGARRYPRDRRSWRQRMRDMLPNI